MQSLKPRTIQQIAVGDVRNRSGLNDAATPAIAFRSVGKTFRNGTVALRDVSLVVQPGEFVSIVGPSGCGKSTLLRIASKLTPATTGRVKCPAPHSIGYVFQDPTLLPWRTVEGNVKLPCEMQGMPRREQDMITREVLEVVGLCGFEKHRPSALSGGMRMRVSLARSLAMSPKLFLFDEPFGALDEISRQHLNEELLRLFIQKRFAAIFVTHSVSEAVYLSNRVVVMSARPGRILAVFDVPLAFPRREEQRFEAEYVEVSAAISRVLRRGNE
jgi:NitT/TauT family transport system ATP-binding protein